MLYRTSVSIVPGNEQENPPSNSAVDLVQALADGLQGHSALEVLWLHQNRIGDAGLQALGCTQPMRDDFRGQVQSDSWVCAASDETSSELQLGSLLCRKGGSERNSERGAGSWKQAGVRSPPPKP